MMQQNPNPLDVPTAPPNRHDFSMEERIQVLSQQDSNAIILMGKKKELICKLRDSMERIVHYAEILDNQNNGSRMNRNYVQKIPVKRSWYNSYNNKQLALVIVHLFEPAKAILKHLEEQDLARSIARGNLNLRNNSVARPHYKDPEMKKVLQKVVDISKQVESRLQDLMVESMDLPKQPSLTKSQRESIFSASRVPNNIHYRKCLMCGHESINEPVENEDIFEYNQGVTRKYRERSRAWNEYQEKLKGGRNVPFPKDPTSDNGALLRRKPTMGKHKSHLLMCMCSTSMCYMHNSNDGSTCPIKCINPETGERFPVEGNPPRCICHRCDCRCQARYQTSDIPIITDVLQKKAAGGGATNNNDNNNTTANNNAFATMFINSIATAASNRAHQQNNNNNSSTSTSTSSASSRTRTNTSSLSEQQRRSAGFIHDVAHNMATYGMDNVQATEIDQLRNAMGRKENVVLPTGHNFNTRTLNMSSDQHARNNNLLLCQPTSENNSNNNIGNYVQPGMISRREIDYTNHVYDLTDDYKKARQQWVSTSATAINVDAVMPMPPLPQQNIQQALSPLTVPSASTSSSSSSNNNNNNIISTSTEKPSAPTPKTAMWDRIKKRNNKKTRKFGPDMSQEQKREQTQEALKTAYHLKNNDKDYKFVLDTIMDDSDEEMKDPDSQEVLGNYERVFMDKPRSG